MYSETVQAVGSRLGGSGTARGYNRSMRSRPLAVLLVLLWAATCARGRDPEPQAQPDTTPERPPAAQPAASTRPRIVVLGDSLTAGLGLPVDEAYPALLQRKIDAAGYHFEVVNGGVSGDTTAGGLRRLDWVLDGDVRILIVALGGNDALRGLPPAEMRDNLKAIIDRAKRRGIRVLLAGMIAPGNFGREYTAAFTDVFRNVAREERVSFIPFLLQGVAGRADLNQTDGIHPNSRGAAIVAETVWRALEPMLSS
jgi:acyl-CoA thioesterase-1